LYFGDADFIGGAVWADDELVEFPSGRICLVSIAPDPLNRQSKRRLGTYAAPPFSGLSRSSQNSVAAQTTLKPVLPFQGLGDSCLSIWVEDRSDPHQQSPDRDG
jgi:hypothetical protein